MNRVHHLQETLEKNIVNNLDYNNLEIILLDYNSADGMSEWCKRNLQTYIREGLLTYFRTNEPLEFNHSHSKNLAFRLATGNIVCNVNADNFLRTGFACHLNRVFSTTKRVFITPNIRHLADPGIAGLIGVEKSDFLSVGGFDERMSVYGWEDVDLCNRLENLGLRRQVIPPEINPNSIAHEMKYDKDKLVSRIHAAYIDPADPTQAYSSRLLILFKDNTFKSGTIINNANKQHKRDGNSSGYRFQYEVENNSWSKGQWYENDLLVSLDGATDISGTGQQLVYRKTDRFLIGEDNGPSLCRVDSQPLLEMIAYFEMDFRNRRIMLTNAENKRISANNGVFGRATVYRNFDTANPISV